MLKSVEKRNEIENWRMMKHGLGFSCRHLCPGKCEEEGKVSITREGGVSGRTVQVDRSTVTPLASH